jgi:hypothetical protein
LTNKLNRNILHAEITLDVGIDKKSSQSMYVLEQKLSSSDTVNWLIAHTKYGPAKLKQRNGISRKQQCNNKCFYAFALGIGPLFPVLSTLFIPDSLQHMYLYCRMDTYKSNCRVVSTPQSQSTFLQVYTPFITEIM